VLNCCNKARRPKQAPLPDFAAGRAQTSINADESRDKYFDRTLPPQTFSSGFTQLTELATAPARI
jgi:hypothetical protein